MMRPHRILALVFVATMLAACGSVPKIDCNQATLAPIKTVAVIKVPEPKTYMVYNPGHPGVAFGLVGGLIAAADQIGKQDQFTEAMKKQNFAPVSGGLADSVVTQLRQRGYDARVENGPWEEVDGKMLLPFEKINSSADGVLVVGTSLVGFWATGPMSEYMPTVTAVASLLGKDRKEPIYRGYHATGWKPSFEGWKHTPHKTGFANFDALMADPKKSAGALDDAVAAIAVSIAEDLKRK